RRLSPGATEDRASRLDAIIAGVAEITGVDRVTDPRILGGAETPAAFTGPVSTPWICKYRWLEYLRTPSNYVNAMASSLPETSKESDRLVNNTELDAGRIRELPSSNRRPTGPAGRRGEGFRRGAAMALAYNARRTTRIIDGVFSSRDVVLDAAEQVRRHASADEHGFSDGVVQMMPQHDDDHPAQKIGRALTIEIASPRYLLAMKRCHRGKSQGARRRRAAVQPARHHQGVGHRAVVARYFGSGAVGAQEFCLRADHRARRNPLTQGERSPPVTVSSAVLRMTRIAGGIPSWGWPPLSALSRQSPARGRSAEAT
ncbi:hypothetical protein GS531_25095, partial [Rhodococcus hoagii]|nr:hypothetical protein [Prescottella equi]